MEDSTPRTILQVVGPPAWERGIQDRRVWWYRCRCRRQRRRGKWSWWVPVRAQFAVELTREQGAQPSTDIDIALGTAAVESLAQFGLDAELDESTTQYVILKDHIVAQRYHLAPQRWLLI